MGTSSGHLQAHAQAHRLVIAVAIGLTHQRFGALVLALHKALADAWWQEGQEDQDVFPPGAPARAHLDEFGWPGAWNGCHPGIQSGWGLQGGHTGRPAT